MSTNNSVQEEKELQQVIAKAFGNKPVQLRAGQKQRGYVEVTGADDSKPIRFPVKDVFCFEQDLFAQLDAAYKEHDSESLRSLWTRAVPYG